MHPRAVVAIIGLGHECRGLAIGMCHLVDHVLVFQDVVGLLGQRPKDQPQLMLGRRHLVVMLVDLHPIRFMVESISERISCAASTGGKGKYPPLTPGRCPVLPTSYSVSEFQAASTPSTSKLTLLGEFEYRTSSNRKNSASGPK